MRKRAQRKSRPTIDEPKHVSMKALAVKEEKTPRFNVKKNWWIGVTLVGIFLLIIFMNTYYNATSEIAINPEGEGLNKFYLSGPDPYYNMRLVEETHDTGIYPYYSENDPLLNYPLGRSGARAPLFNMMALGFSRTLTPFMDEIDAIGYSMLFIPALFGALVIFPVYFIGKEVFNKKTGLIGALFIALIPIHLGSGHGSAYSLFDHDSFNLLLFFLTFLFLIKSLKEKDPTKSFLYSILGGVALAALSMTWVKSQYLYVVIAIYAVVQIFIDILRNKVDFDVVRSTSVLLFTGYIVSAPVIIAGYGEFRPDVNLFLCLGVAIFGVLAYLFRMRRIPWTLSMPVVFGIGGFVLILMHPSVLDSVSNIVPFIGGPLASISEMVWGSGIYGGKVSMTIAEANTYEISHSVMSFGPALYWLGWTGFLFLVYYFFTNKKQPGRDYLFLIVLFVVSIWLTGIAGRFINDMVPIIALLAGWTIWMLIEWIDYKQMVRNIRSAGGGFHGIRRGIKFLHVFGICFIAFLVLLPNAFIAFDAAIPMNAETDDPDVDLKEAMFGEDHLGAFGLGIGKEKYWGVLFEWLNEQDQDIENPADRPGFISWWDYGFYEVAMGGHPTVADNFQDGIPPAGNFHTATSEEEAVAVLIVRLLEGDVKKNGGTLSNGVKSVLANHLGMNYSVDIKNWIEEPKNSPSYGEKIQTEYHQYIREEINRQHLTVGSEWPINAVYHDISALLTNETYGLNDEEITMLYHDIQDVTGWSIRYYGVEGYDKQIFNIFAFLSDKSLVMVGTPEDDFIEATVDGYEVDSKGDWSPGTNFTGKSLKWYLELDDNDKRYIVLIDQGQNYLEPYFDTMFYRVYFGPKEYQSTLQVPCTGMKHFYAEYLTDILQYSYYQGIGAAVCAKYYEGAKVNGTVVFNDQPIDAQAVISKGLEFWANQSFEIDHDAIETSNGNFSLLAGAGAKLQIRRYPELDIGVPWHDIKPFVMKEIDLKISDDDAMRKTDNWQMALGNVTIEPANASVFVYENLDDNETYNATVDKPLSNITVVMAGINELELNRDEVGNIIGFYPATDEAGNAKLDKELIYSTDENGSYTFTSLLPGYYMMVATIDGIPIDRSIVSIESGNSSFNISKPKPASINGNVYYKGPDGTNETISDANVSIYYYVQNSGIQYINSTMTDGAGSYSFDSLTPGIIQGITINQYLISVNKTSSEDKPLYQAEIFVSPEENETTWYNISTDLAYVTVSGYTKNDDGDVIGNTVIKYEIDGSQEANTAVNGIAQPSNETTGAYSIELSPGKYNVTAEQIKGETVVYSYTGKLTVAEGAGSVTDENVVLLKESISISGYVRDKSTNEVIESVTIQYIPNGSVVNNNATAPENPTSDENGYYNVELAAGSYNISAKKYDKGEEELYRTEVYSLDTTLDITSSDDGSSKTFYLDRKTVNVTGTVSGFDSDDGLLYNETAIIFNPDGDVKDNNASSNIGYINAGNVYGVELKPGSYNISATTSRAFNIIGVNYTYTYKGKIVITDDVSTAIPRNIILVKEEVEETTE